jgi:REP element-mobilizing transposase RayT
MHEKSHRLSRVCYRGFVAVAYTACLRLAVGRTLDDELRRLIEVTLWESATKHDSSIPAWCLMPDHVHVIYQGKSVKSDTWKAIVGFKQRTGFWLAKHRPEIVWQKDFYDHVIRSDESLETHVMYIVTNPVRAGVVGNWWEYPYLGGTMVEALRTEQGPALG